MGPEQVLQVLVKVTVCRIEDERVQLLIGLEGSPAHEVNMTADEQATLTLRGFRMPT